MRRMALLRNLEQSLGGLVEGTIGRVFRTEVRPTEIARKLAREMEINKRVSLSRTYAPTDYLVYLSPDDRARYAGVESSIAEELGAYLLEHARRERLVLVRRPLVEFRTDKRLRLGEFGIEARTAPISAEEAPARQPAAEAEAPRAAAPQADRGRRPEPAAAAPEPAVPLGNPAADDRPGSIEPIDEGYADPYANDGFGESEDSGEFGWVDAPQREREPSPEEREPEPVAEAASAPESREKAGDWLDPVEDWNPKDPEPASAPEPAAAPKAVQPHAPSPPVPPAPRTPDAAPLAGMPWIDPTLQRQQRPQFAPPVVPARQPPRPAGAQTLLVDGTPHELTGDRIVLGRSRSADVVVSDPSVSRQHLELRQDDRGWYAVDLGSTNGSQVNGDTITEARRLEPGQRIKLGHADAIIEVR
jgi:hypothetical protein